MIRDAVMGAMMHLVNTAKEAEYDVLNYNPNTNSSNGSSSNSTLDAVTLEWYEIGAALRRADWVIHVCMDFLVGFFS